MIRNVAVHIANEQPLMADLYEVPSATDAGLLCVNLRTIDGKRPVFIDKIENTFFFPYLIVRFLEIPNGALERHRAETGGRRSGDAGWSAGDAAAEGVASTLPAVIEAGAPEADDLDDEIDEDFLRRIREV